MKNKICNSCGKELTDKNWSKCDQNKHYYICKKCKSIRASIYNKTHKKQRRINQWKYHLQISYGLTIEKRDEIAKAQNYRCAICGKLEKDNRQRLSVDHSHQTNYIRGLLCGFCNRMLLRFFKDKKILWEGFVKYAQNALENDKDWE